MTQGEEIKDALKRANLTQKEYCRERGISMRTFQHWVHDESRMGAWLLRMILRDIAEYGEEKASK